MGICLSSRSAAADRPTAKLILQDGRLEEFPYPVRASYVVQSYDPGCFVCNADELEFDGVVGAVPGDEDLRPGELYFALPLGVLGRTMGAQEMAALAVRANSALKRSAAGRRGSRRRVVFPVLGEGECSRDSGGCKSGAGDGGGGGGKDGRMRRGRRNKFTAELCAIPE